MSGFGTEKRNLTRSGIQSVEAVNVMYPLTCYSRVYGYDIESDGSLGTLAIPGIIARNSSGFALCVPEELIPPPSKLSWIPLSFLAGIGHFHGCVNLQDKTFRHGQSSLASSWEWHWQCP